MARVRIKLPNLDLDKPKTHKALFARKVNLQVHDKIDSIVDHFDCSKWIVIDAILSHALGVKSEHNLNLKKWLKK